MTDCAGYARNISDGKEFHCRDEATATITAGCIHEHVGPRDLCDYHARELRAGEQVCGHCLEMHGECVLVALNGATPHD